MTKTNGKAAAWHMNYIVKVQLPGTELERQPLLPHSQSRDLTNGNIFSLCILELQTSKRLREIFFLPCIWLFLPRKCAQKKLKQEKPALPEGLTGECDARLCFIHPLYSRFKFFFSYQGIIMFLIKCTVPPGVLCKTFQYHCNTSKRVRPLSPAN